MAVQRGKAISILDMQSRSPTLTFAYFFLSYTICINYCIPSVHETCRFSPDPTPSVLGRLYHLL